MSKGPWYKRFAGILPALFSCRRYTEMASLSLDNSLSAKEKACMRFHHVICMVCRRFRRQLDLIEEAGHRLENIDSSDKSSPDQVLPQNAREKIHLAVKKEESELS
jgi:hypothetical protein